MHKTLNPNDRQEDEDNIGVYPKTTLKMVLETVCQGTDVIVQ
jgi:hypothetical protein